MQANKALWQTGGFLFGQGLTTQLSQWAGETNGPLLAADRAVRRSVRPEQADGAAAARAALLLRGDAGGLRRREALSGKRAARWMLAIVARSARFFVLEARMTCGSCAALYLLPIALCLIARGITKPAALYPGMIALALTAYAQDMYFFIAPASILACAIIALIFGRQKRHAAIAGAIGLLLCVPAMLTAFVNLTGAEGMTLFGLIRIPRRGALKKDLYGGKSVCARQALDGAGRRRISGASAREYPSGDVYPGRHAGAVCVQPAADGAGCAGAVCAMDGWLPRGGGEGGRARDGCGDVRGVTLAALVMFGSIGMLNTSGTTGLFDHSALILFDAVLMAAGLCTIERKNLGCAAAMGALDGCQFRVAGGSVVRRELPGQHERVFSGL